jgi:agmatinase
MSATASFTAAADADEALVLSPWMEVEHLDEAEATIYLSSDGTRIRIPLALHHLLLRFRAPARPGDVCGKDGAGAAKALARLREKGFLVPPGEVPARQERQVTDPPVRLFDAPAQKLAPARADVVVLGVPWDFGEAGAAGARRGPLALRDISLQLLYRLDRGTGRPVGWYDADRRRPVLSGVSIADAGDVVVRHGEGRSAVFGRVREVVDTLARDGALPVVLGGDRSVACPLIDQRRGGGPLDVIRIGRPPAGPGGTALLRPVLSLPGVDRFTQIVPAGLEGLRGDEPDGYACLSIDAALAGMPEPGPGEKRRVHVGIDVDALACAGDTRPSLAYRQVHALLCRLGHAHRIVSVDLCGINPWTACWGALSMTVVHLLVTALSAAKDPA